MDLAEAYRCLRLFAEIDHDFGVQFIHRHASGGPDANTDVATKAASQSKQTSTRPFLALSGSSSEQLQGLAHHISTCSQCGLCEKRSQTVPGEGNAAAELMFIGEAPGADEDKLGRPFVGKAGQLLEKMISAMGLQRDEVFIANVLKCRPPDNRKPQEDEIARCLPYVLQQIDIIKPTVICTLGNTPLQALRGDMRLGITRERGRRFMFRGIPVIPTFHPSYLLRNEAAKKPCWADLRKTLGELGRSLPKRS